MAPTRRRRCDVAVVLVSTFPPRECGIGTFSRDLVDGLRGLDTPADVVVAAINGEGEQYDYDSIVRVQLEEGNTDSYVEAAQALNRMRRVDVVSIQHDFGKFGLWDEDGFQIDRLIPMLDALRKPSVVTMHSVTPHPNRLMRETVQGMAERVDAIVVMANIAKVLLQEDYGLGAGQLAKVRQIPHGVPACRRTRVSASLQSAKRAVGLAGRTVMSTFGLLNEGKGIEYAIEALPMLVDKFPDLLYLVIGETHPEVRKLRGESYRNELRALVKRLGMQGHVRFVNRFLSQKELVEYLAATDVYVTPYLARYQITSGTLAYALGCGKAIVSTPYLYATEALAEGRGVLAEFRNAESIANAISVILGDAEARRGVEARVADYGRSMAWPVVAQRYAELFCEIRDERQATPGDRVSA